MTAQTTDQLLTAELASIGRTPTAADLQLTRRLGFRPARFRVLVDGRGVSLAMNRLQAVLQVRAAHHRHPGARVEVETRATGARVEVGPGGQFLEADRYMWT